ncbi:MAG TPA: MBL fold metallo-hydrolase, partial [Terriglobia bacterium]|nr:MBL fold metallo-hydrolase [Terriglobia bacterium]
NRDLQCVHIESQGASACFVSDLVPTHAHLPYPWIMSFDLYPMETLANRRKLLPRLVQQKTLVIFPHDAGLPCARLEEQKGKITAVAAS